MTRAKKREVLEKLLEDTVAIDDENKQGKVKE